MNASMLDKVLKQFFPLAILVVVLAAFLGSAHVGMARDANGQMTGCPLMGASALCEMNPLTHIAKWQGLLSALPEREAAAFLAAVLAGLSTIFLLWSVRYTPHVFIVPARALRRRTAPVLVRSTLQEAFSNGILNPKIF